MKKIRYWLIKQLGGMPNPTVNTIPHLAVTNTLQSIDVLKLQAAIQVPSNFPEVLIRHKLAEQFIKELCGNFKNTIHKEQYETTENKVDIIATLKVLELNRAEKIDNI